MSNSEGSPRGPTCETFWVFGSILEKGVGARDIDLVIHNDPQAYDCEADFPDVCLADYELIAQATGKSIDLFLLPCRDNFSLAGWYDPAKPDRGWIINYRFTGKWWFTDLKPMTRDELVALARRRAATEEYHFEDPNSQMWWLDA
jgi:hypothetical protein